MKAKLTRLQLLAVKANNDWLHYNDHGKSLLKELRAKKTVRAFKKAIKELAAGVRFTALNKQEQRALRIFYQWVKEEKELMQESYWAMRDGEHGVCADSCG